MSNNINDLLKIFNLNTNMPKNLIEDNMNNFINNFKRNNNDQNIIYFLENCRKNILDYYTFNNFNFQGNNKNLPINLPINKSIDTFKNNYNTGSFNPIKKDTIKFAINIDSFFRHNYELTNNSNNFTYIFDSPLKNVISYSINSIELPNVWYSISSFRKNNMFTIEIFNYNDGTNNFLDSSHNIIIPDGNYSATELSSIINNYFNNTEQGLDFLLFEINNITGKTIIRAKNEIVDNNDFPSQPKPFDPTDTKFSPNFSFNLKFDLPEDQPLREQQENIKNNFKECEYTCEQKQILKMKTRDLRKNFGFLIGYKDYSYTIDGSNQFIDEYNFQQIIDFKAYSQGENIFGDTIPRYLFLLVNDFNSNSKNTVLASDSGNFNLTNIIAKVPINANSFNIINQSEGDRIFRKRNFFGPVTIKKLNVKLVDKFGDLIDIKNNNFSFTIEVEQIYS